MTDKTQPVKLVEEIAGKEGIDPSLIAGVEVKLEAVIGAATMTVAELMKLEKGSSVALESSLERDVELRLNGVAVARGELVAVGDNYGVRIVEILR